MSRTRNERRPKPIGGRTSWPPLSYRAPALIPSHLRQLATPAPISKFCSNEVARDPRARNGASAPCRRRTPKVLRQFAHGTLSSAEAPGRNGYHNAEWARKMQRHRRWREIGLEPVRSDGTLSTAEAPGKTSDKMIPSRRDARITAGGPFDQVITRFLSLGSAEARSRLRWQSFDLAEGALTGQPATAKKKAASKTKYTCPACGENARPSHAGHAKPGASLWCGFCGMPLESEEEEN